MGHRDQSSVVESICCSLLGRDRCWCWLALDRRQSVGRDDVRWPGGDEWNYSRSQRHCSVGQPDRPHHAARRSVPRPTRISDLGVVNWPASLHQLRRVNTSQEKNGGISGSNVRLTAAAADAVARAIMSHLET